MSFTLLWEMSSALRNFSWKKAFQWQMKQNNFNMNWLLRALLQEDWHTQDQHRTFFAQVKCFQFSAFDFLISQVRMTETQFWTEQCNQDWFSPAVDSCVCHPWWPVSQCCSLTVEHKTSWVHTAPLCKKPHIHSRLGKMRYSLSKAEQKGIRKKPAITTSCRHFQRLRVQKLHEFSKLCSYSGASPTNLRRCHTMKTYPMSEANFCWSPHTATKWKRVHLDRQQNLTLKGNINVFRFSGEEKKLAFLVEMWPHVDVKTSTVCHNFLCFAVHQTLQNRDRTGLHTCSIRFW